MNRIAGSGHRATSSSQTTTTKPMTAGQRPSARRVVGQVPAADAEPPDEPGAAGRGASRTGRGSARPGRRTRTASPRRPSRRPTGTASRRRRRSTPPTMPWTTIQAQARSPMARRPSGSTRRRQVAGGRSGRGAVGADVADEHEDERQGDGRGGAGEVDGQRQPARVRRVEGVGEHGPAAPGRRAGRRRRGGRRRPWSRRRRRAASRGGRRVSAAPEAARPGRRRPRGPGRGRSAG